MSETALVDTTMGRMIFNDAIPQDLGFVDRTDPATMFDYEINLPGAARSSWARSCDQCIRKHGTIAAEVLDHIKARATSTPPGRHHRRRCRHAIVPEEERDHRRAEKKVDKITGSTSRGLITDEERYRGPLRVWNRPPRTSPTLCSQPGPLQPHLS